MTDLEADSGSSRQVTEPYEELASIYDFVMRHVDYVHWVNYTLSLLRSEGGGKPAQLLDLACGTGNASLCFAEHGIRVRGCDASAAMIRVARKKASDRNLDLNFEVRDLRSLEGIGRYEAAVCLYDSLNYLLELKDVDLALTQIAHVLTPEALFIFDVCTERNSLSHFRDVRDIEQGPGYKYSRHSYYKQGSRLQYNAFEIHREDGLLIEETHVQRIYPYDELVSRITSSPFRLIAAYDGFSLRPGSERSDRVHFLLQAP